jgi:hypothetical protein
MDGERTVPCNREKSVSPTARAPVDRLLLHIKCQVDEVKPMKYCWLHAAQNAPL